VVDLDVHAHQSDVDGTQASDRVRRDGHRIALQGPAAQRELERLPARRQQQDGRMTHRARRDDPGLVKMKPRRPNQ
jgi:hypothetical protein